MILGMGDWLQATIGVTVVFTLALVSYALVRRALLPFLKKAISKSAIKWDDVLLDQKLLHRIALVAPFALIWIVIELIPHIGRSWPILIENNWLPLVVSGTWLEPVQQLAQAALVVVVILMFGAAIDACHRFYRTFPISRERPIKGYLQIAKIVITIFGVVIFLAVLTNQEVGYFVTGLGAMTAVLLLIFKDTILSLVASVQLTQNDMIRVGDWIEMPGQNADGDVIDIALHTVKVQNWDKTITTIPTSKLIQDSFKNWRSMPLSGGRRIKRSISLDMSSVRFLTDEEIDRFSKFAPLAKYMEDKLAELEKHNSSLEVEEGDFGDPRRLTNLGTLRAYVIQYLKSHPKIHQHGMTLLVRQLQPNAQGLPLEIYGFTNDTAWVNYEAIQSNIFDHLLSMLPEFGLRAFQEPTGSDIIEAERRAQ